ncbi:MAG: MBL fold metallo-hydrolase [Pseudonocardiaceae bacterium]
MAAGTDQRLATPAYFPGGATYARRPTCPSSELRVFQFARERPLVSHVLLCETEGGLVLIDSGIGRSDIAAPESRLGRVALALGPALRAEETAAHQIEALGYQLSDVRHIVATHLDYDHIGGATFLTRRCTRRPPSCAPRGRVATCPSVSGIAARTSKRRRDRAPRIVMPEPTLAGSGISSGAWCG